MTGDCQVRFCERLRLKCFCLLDSFTSCSLNINKVMAGNRGLCRNDECPKKQFFYFNQLAAGDASGKGKLSDTSPGNVL